MPLDAKKTASATLMVSRSPRVVVRTMWISWAIGPATSSGQVSSSSRATSSASSLEPKNEAASDVTRIRNGNSASKVDSAIWLAIAQPSAAVEVVERVDERRDPKGEEGRSNAAPTIGCRAATRPYQSAASGRPLHNT